MSFNTKLINLLKTDPRFADDEGELVIAAVQDAAWKTDRALVKLLLPTPTFKSKNAYWRNCWTRTSCTSISRR